MTRSSDRDHRITSKTSCKLKNAQKLASRLQKIINTGKTSKRDLIQIDRFFSYCLHEQTESIIQAINSSLVNGIKLKNKEKSFYHSLIDSLKELRSIIDVCRYSDLIKKDNTVSIKKLNNIINIDSELISIIISIREYLFNKLLKKEFLREDHTEGSYFLNELIVIFKNRKALFSSV
jgi:hypothetical protein